MLPKTETNKKDISISRKLLMLAACIMVPVVLLLAINDSYNQRETSIDPNAEALVVSNSRTWAMKANRNYVWLEIEIDGVNIGRVTIELYTDIVPKAAENFRVLSTGERGDALSFKKSICHRILKNFIVQCGDFEKGTGMGGYSIYGRTFDDEPAGLALKHDKRYLLEMANIGPNTNGSQFCFMLRASPHLNGHHVVFGEVVEGFSVVDQMEAAGKLKDADPMTHVVKILDGGEIK